MTEPTHSALDPALRERILQQIGKHPVVLFMKGSRRAPQCGFSQRIVDQLDDLLDEYHTVNVLADEPIRSAMKDFSGWPTFPQLYVRGEFVGGADIVSQLVESGELATLFGELVAQRGAPVVTATPEALAALKGFLEGTVDEHVRLAVSHDFEHSLSIGAREEGDWEVPLVGGLLLLVERRSGPRARGVHIELKQTERGAAFKIHNPQQPAEVLQLSAPELKAKLDAGEPLRLIDVRTSQEVDTARIERAEFLDDTLLDELFDVPKDTVLVFQCHHGVRSQRAAEEFVRRGFRHVYNLTGGIDAWSTEVDASVPRY